MCGISCYFYFDNTNNSYPLLDMNNSLENIKHRGPDDTQKYISSCSRCVLGFVRLSIIDLNGGQQPISNEMDDIHVVVNGELYGFEEIREQLELKGHVFKTKSDSEIVVHLYEEYGLSFVDHIRGEYAICIYDARKNKFILVRDRYGVRPIYYTVMDNKVILAASEIKAFIPMGWKAEWDVDSIVHNGAYLDNRTCFKNVYKLPPGHYLTATASGSISIRPYWDMDYPDKHIKETRSVEEMICGIQTRFENAVRERLVADVPVGVFLSGGLDSSVVAGVASKIMREKDPKAKLKAFSISFEDGGEFDEGDVAERTAKFLNIDLKKLTLSEDIMLGNLEDLVWYIEQPTFNLSSVGRYLLAKCTRDEGFKVVLTGEGSDEHFGGYIYFIGDYLLEKDHSEPKRVISLSDEERQTKRRKFNSEDNFNRYMVTSKSNNNDDISNALLNGMQSPAFIGNALSISADYFSKKAITQYGCPNRALTLAEGTIDGIIRHKIKHIWHPLNSAMYIETKTMLVNGILNVHGDRSDMAFAVEARPPFLDHRLTEYVMGLPPSVKIKANKDGPLNEKWILKEASKPYVTEEIYKRLKAPFIAPMARGHNAVFSSMINKYLSRENIENLGWIDYQKVKLSKEKYFESSCTDKRIYQDFLLLISFVILSQKFNVPVYCNK